MGHNVKVSWTPGSLAFVGVHITALAALYVGWSPAAIVVAVAVYWARMFAITAGYHRYFAHASFRTSRGFQFVLAWLGASSAQKGPLWWAGHHRNHHLYSDTEKDIHSPARGGFWWSHIGWILSDRYDAIEWNSIKEFARYPELRFIDAKAWLPPAALAAGMWALGALLESRAPSLRTNGMQMAVWGFSISTVVLYHATFSINSLAHVWGDRRFETADDSRNNLWLALLTMGEGWHNNHHRVQYSARQGFFWWEVDMTHYVLAALSRLGVVWDLRAPPRAVLAEAGGSSTRRSEGTVREELVYSSPHGTRLSGDLYVPAGSGPFPTVLVVHGGGWTSRNRSDMTSISKRLANGGYAVFNIDYRKAPEHLYPAAVDDCRAAIRWLRAYASAYRLDPERLAAFGYSSGAHLAALVGYDKRPGEADVQALVLGGTPADLRVYPDSPLVRGFLGKRLSDDPALYARASPIVHVAPGGPPAFIYHGRQDLLVGVGQARALKKALDEAGVEAELYEMSLATHYSAFLFNGRSIDRAIRFLDRRLRVARAVRGLSRRNC